MTIWWMMMKMYRLKYNNSALTMADSGAHALIDRWGGGDVQYPGPISFIFMWFSGKKLPNNGLALHFGGLAPPPPPSGKSRIRQ